MMTHKRMDIAPILVPSVNGLLCYKPDCQKAAKYFVDNNLLCASHLQSRIRSLFSLMASHIVKTMAIEWMEGH